MPRSSTQQNERIKLRDLCDRIGVSYRDARYALARGILPEGIEAEPGRGNHRLFSPSQAMHLAVVLKLKAAGVHTPLAGQIAEWSSRLRGVAMNLGWDHRFSPFDGSYHTDHQWFIEVGDGQFVRFVTDANPSRDGLDRSPWINMETRREAKGASPVVMILVDLSALAEQVQGPPA